MVGVEVAADSEAAAGNEVVADLAVVVDSAVEDSVAGAVARNAVVRVASVVEVAEQAVSVAAPQADLVVPADSAAAVVDLEAAACNKAARLVPVDSVAVRVESVFDLAQALAVLAEQPVGLGLDRALGQEARVDRRVALESGQTQARETPELQVATAKVEPTELTTLLRTRSPHKEQRTETPRSTTITTTQRCSHSNPTPGFRPMSSTRRCILTPDTRTSRSDWEWQRNPFRTTTVATS